jgi:hypothetical protein
MKKVIHSSQQNAGYLAPRETHFSSEYRVTTNEQSHGTLLVKSGGQPVDETDTIVSQPLSMSDEQLRVSSAKNNVNLIGKHKRASTGNTRIRKG